MRKLLPAAGMLSVSAMMLATSTYAWFTMSREVEVKNIKLTASVPEDLQISLGKLDTDDGSGDGYSNNYGNLVAVANASNANNGQVDEPGTVSEYWANTVDVSKYYKLGTILPASSTDGLNVYFTPDAAGVGKNLKTNAKFYKAVEGDTVESDGSTAATGDEEHTSTYEATLHAITGKSDADISGDTWEPALATAYNVTMDAGYFVDIPVWIRSGAKEDVYVAVDAYVTTNSTIDGDDLYLAARAVILGEDKDVTSNLLEIKKEKFDSTDSIVDFMDTTNASGEAVASIDGNNAPTYGTEDHYDGSLLSNDAYKIEKADDGENYGAATKLWIRVWLEGEDPNCWNDNAGQDFNISLKFTKDRLYNSTAATAAGVAQDYPNANAWTDVEDTETNSLKAGDQVTVSGSIKDANDPDETVAIEMVYTFDGTDWKRTFGSYPGKTVYIGSTEIADEAALESHLKTNVTKKSQLSTEITITETAASGG
jgi:hypothetical protein